MNMTTLVEMGDIITVSVLAISKNLPTPSPKIALGPAPYASFLVISLPTLNPCIFCFSTILRHLIFSLLWIVTFINLLKICHRL